MLHLHGLQREQGLSGLHALVRGHQYRHHPPRHGGPHPAIPPSLPRARLRGESAVFHGVRVRAVGQPQQRAVPVEGHLLHHAVDDAARPVRPHFHGLQPMHRPGQRHLEATGRQLRHAQRVFAFQQTQAQAHRQAVRQARGGNVGRAVVLIGRVGPG